MYFGLLVLTLLGSLIVFASMASVYFPVLPFMIASAYAGMNWPSGPTVKRPKWVCCAMSRSMAQLAKRD
jgi:hypothetical protein